jgi:hypothetical protein
MTEYHGDGGLGAATRGIWGLINMGLAHQSTWDKSEARVGAQVGGESAGARVDGARTSVELVGPVC